MNTEKHTISIPYEDYLRLIKAMKVVTRISEINKFETGACFYNFANPTEIYYEALRASAGEEMAESISIMNGPNFKLTF